MHRWDRVVDLWNCNNMYLSLEVLVEVMNLDLCSI